MHVRTGWSRLLVTEARWSKDLILATLSSHTPRRSTPSKHFGANNIYTHYRAARSQPLTILVNTDAFVEKIIA